MDMRKCAVLGYKAIGNLNSNDGLFQIVYDDEKVRLIFDTNADYFHFNKPVNIKGSAYIDGSQIITAENSLEIDGINASTLCKLPLNDDADLTKENAIISGQKIMDILEHELDAEKIPYINPGYSEIQNVKEALDTLLYVPLAISSFTNNHSINEKGSTVSSVTFTWSYNTSLLKEQSFNGEILPLDIRSKTITNITTDTICKLVSTDGTTNTTKSSSILFRNGMYYGVSVNETIDHATMGTLTKELLESRNKTFTVTAGVGEYIYFGIPKRLGECKFMVGGFEGGFVKLDDFIFNNSSGYTEPYYVYRSDHASLGYTTVSVLPK